MNRFLVAAALLVPAAFAPLVPACSSKAAATQGSNGDASDDQQTTINPFDPDATFVDLDEGTGNGFPDVRPTDANVSCTPDAACPLAGEVCGFRASGPGSGCGAQGICVFSDPPTDINGVILTGCGCEGQPVLYVVSGETAFPVASGNPCDAGASPSDAGDASDGNDAGTDGDATAPDAADD